MPYSEKTYMLEIVNEFSSGPFIKANDSFEEHKKETVIDEYPIEKIITINNSEIEPHVLEALQYAATIADKIPVTGAMVILSVIHIGREGKNASTAFIRLADFLPEADDIKLRGIVPSRINKFHISQQLGEVIKYIFNDIKTNQKIVRIWGRDLVTSSLLCKYDKSLQEFLTSSGMMLEELQDRWFHFLQTDSINSYKRNSESWWKNFNIPLPGVRRNRAGYLAESLETKDKLNIENETSAIAAIISDENTIPPLSIGLIGDWGSGKSFFMKNMEKQVNSMVGNPGYCNNIAIVKFNAWHVSDANLWASIVDHIFTEVWASCQKAGKTIEEARIELNKALNEAKGALFESENQLNYVNNCLAEALKEEEELNKDYAVSKYIEAERRKLLNKVIEAIGWKKPLETYKDIKKSYTEISNTANRTSLVLQFAFKGKSLRSGMTWVSIFIILACLLYLSADVFKDFPFVQKFTQLLATVGGLTGTLLSIVAAPLSKASKLFNDFETNLEKTLSDYEKDRPVGAKLVNVKREYMALDEKVAQLRLKVATLEKDRINLDPFERLTSFIRERAICDTYRSQQGLISLVRRDFEKLSELMIDWKKHRRKMPENIIPVDRIILYIDDLDRCSPQIVVQTLEAIHLLLALDLFVVIVGVDSRWLLRSLDVHYSTLLSSHENEDEEYRISTPQNYLEKIFQVIYAVSPMGEQGFKTYIDYLTGFEAINPVNNNMENAQTLLAENRNLKSASEDKRINTTSETAADNNLTATHQVGIGAATTNGQVDHDNNSEETNEPVLKDSKLRGISINIHEKVYLKQLYPFIQTPRIAKKIVNVYRIIKAKTLLEELDSFDVDGRYKAILMLLSILFNFPQIAELLFKNLSERKIKKVPNETKLFQGVENLAKSIIEDHLQNSNIEISDKDLQSAQNPEFFRKRQKIILQADELKRLGDIVKNVDKKLTLISCEKEALEVSRYSLVTGQVWHTWEKCIKTNK